MPSTDLIILFASAIVMAIWAIATLSATPNHREVNRGNGVIEYHAKWTQNGPSGTSKN